MFAIANTEIKWADFLKKNGLTSNVNFWTPTDWKVSGLKKGAKFYFMLKSPIRKISRTQVLQFYKRSFREL